jgi:predicted ester cyclase
MPTEEHRAVVERFCEEGFEKFNDEAVHELVTDDFHSHPWSVLGIPDGPEGMKQFLGFMRSAFSNARVSVEDVISEDGKVAVRYVFEADHTGELLGIGATGKRVRLPGIFIARIEDRKLAEYWREEDQLSMMQQLGVMLSPEQAAV